MFTEPYNNMNPTLANFFRQVFDGYFMEDIISLNKIKPNSHEFGNCGVAHLLTVCSMLELMGKLLNDGEYAYHSPRAYEYYFKNYLPEYVELKGTILNLARNGSAHHFFSKGIGLERNIDSDLIFQKSGDGTFILNISAFSNMLIQSINKVKIDLANDPILQERVINNLKTLLTESKKSFDEHQNELLVYVSKTTNSHQPYTPSTYSTIPPTTE